MAVTVFTVRFGVMYPLFSTAVGQVAFGEKADGSLVCRNGGVLPTLAGPPQR